MGTYTADAFLLDRTSLHVPLATFRVVPSI
jgi:hypothetical protein